MADPAIRQVITLPPADTVRAFEARDRLRLTVNWTDMWQAEHAREFTVSKLQQLDIVAEIQAAVADFIANGGTPAEFTANLEPYLRSKGWWGAVTDPSLTGTDQPVNIGPARLRTIYDTNLRVSRAAGRWARIQALKGDRPFLRYTAVLDARTRPLHRAWHGTILPVDDEWWDTHYPPCGWYCRCTVRQLSQRDLDRNGWKVSPRPPLDPVPYTRPGTGEVIQVPRGIDPGFAYNAGKASLGAIGDKARRTLERTAVNDLPAAQQAVAELIANELPMQLLAEPDVAFPVMVVEPATVNAGTLSSPVVTLNAGAVADQAAKKRALTPDVYRSLPRLGRDPAIVATKDGRAILAGPAAGDQWQVVTIDPKMAAVTAIENMSRYSVDRRLYGALVARDDTLQVLPDAVEKLLRSPASERVAFDRAGAESPADVQGYLRVLTANEARHMLLGHGVASRDPLPIDAVDIGRIPEIIARGNLDQQVERDRRELIWTWARGSWGYVYVERVGTRTGRLTGRTLFRVPLPNNRYFGRKGESQ